ncbi:MAG: glycosyltransferase family 2 protein [Acidaminococcaceae bacterium]|nr:glycosyltransferase family 2 protein [Acidaminococcaceae bacterium]
MSRKLVSIITPCYNGGKYINHLLDSVLKQTYIKIEMFVFDDGSIDNSSEIIKSYIPKFTKRGYTLKYVYQKNQGQSTAINNALKLVKGDYLVWPDADDYYADKSSISDMVKVLEQSDNETSMVRVQYNVLNEEEKVLNKLGVRDDTRYKTDLFEDALLGINGFWYPPGGYMAKMSKVDQLILNREIYTEKNAGQNFQLYLPLLYRQKCLTIEKNLYNIVAHDDSHSRNMTTNGCRQKIYYRTIKNTLKNIPLAQDYRSYLLKNACMVAERNNNIGGQAVPYRIYVKNIIKGAIPYGIVMLYKRRYH